MEHTFELTICSTENHTWQGILKGCGESFRFQSELELLMELARRIDPECCASFRWESSPPIDTCKKEGR